MTDKERIDWLEKQNDNSRYTGRCVFRWSLTGRGWRLHETTREGYTSVREAIDAAKEADNAMRLKDSQ